MLSDQRLALRNLARELVQQLRSHPTVDLELFADEKQANGATMSMLVNVLRGIGAAEYVVRVEPDGTRMVLGNMLKWNFDDRKHSVSEADRIWFASHPPEDDGTRIFTLDKRQPTPPGPTKLYKVISMGKMGNRNLVMYKITGETVQTQTAQTGEASTSSSAQMPAGREVTEDDRLDEEALLSFIAQQMPAEREMTEDERLDEEALRSFIEQQITSDDEIPEEGGAAP